MAHAGELQVAGAPHQLGQPAAVGNGQKGVVGAMDDEGGHIDLLQCLTAAAVRDDGGKLPGLPFRMMATVESARGAIVQSETGQ